MKVKIDEQTLEAEARRQLKQELVQEAIDKVKKRLRRESWVVVGKFFQKKKEPKK